MVNTINVNDPFFLIYRIALDRLKMYYAIVVARGRPTMALYRRLSLIMSSNAIETNEILSNIR